MTENEISYQIIGAAIEIHKTIGLGLLESAYENALAYELRELGFNVNQQNQCHLYTKVFDRILVIELIY